MQSPRIQTLAVTVMLFSVLFLTGCGRDDDQAQTAIPRVRRDNTLHIKTPENTTDKAETISQNTPEQQVNTAQPTTTPTTTATTQTTADKTLTSSFQKYGTPAGDEEVKVTATIDSKGIVKDVSLAYVANANASEKFQAMFSEGIKAQVIGKEVKNINVGIVNGSSLTGIGFNKAISQIASEYYGKN